MTQLQDTIALLPVLYKLFSKILTSCLSEVVKQHQVLSPAQNGFQKGHSTVGHVATLCSIIEEAQALGKELHVAYIDLVGTYDLVPLDKLFATLTGSGIPERLVLLLSNLYKGNTVWAYRADPTVMWCVPAILCPPFSSTCSSTPSSLTSRPTSWATSWKVGWG